MCEHHGVVGGGEEADLSMAPVLEVPADKPAVVRPASNRPIPVVAPDDVVSAVHWFPSARPARSVTSVPSVPSAMPAVRKKSMIPGYDKWAAKREASRRKKEARRQQRDFEEKAGRLSADTSDVQPDVIRSAAADRVRAVLAQVTAEESRWPRGKGKQRVHEATVLQARALRRIATDVGVRVPDEETLIGKGIPGRVFQQVRDRLVEVAGADVADALPEFLKPPRGRY